MTTILNHLFAFWQGYQMAIAAEWHAAEVDSENWQEIFDASVEAGKRLQEFRARIEASGIKEEMDAMSEFDTAVELVGDAISERDHRFYMTYGCGRRAVNDHHGEQKELVDEVRKVLFA